jgi:hypothetical protein
MEKKNNKNKTKQKNRCHPKLKHSLSHGTMEREAAASQQRCSD